MDTPKKRQKAGGRKRGTPNRLTKDLRETLKCFIEQNLGEMQGNFERLKPVEKLAFIEKLLPYLIPKLQSTTLDGAIDFGKLSEQDMNTIISRLKQTAP